MGTLAVLATSHGYSLERLSLLFEHDALLLVRIDQGRQPCPLELVRQIAMHFGEAEGTVARACFEVTPLDHAELYIPRPPRPELGDPL